MPDGSSSHQWAKPLRIGGLELPNRLVLAPMSSVSTLSARLIAQTAGAGLVVTETLSACALVRGSERRHLQRSTVPSEDRLAVQLFGAKLETLTEACWLLSDQGVQWIDLNLGCPVPKFLRKGAGSALMRTPLEIGRIVEAMRRSFHGVLSVKMRSGWDARSRNAPEVAQIAANAGAQLITIHGRTRAQQYRGRADRQLIRRVVEAVPELPVLANGDVTEATDVLAITAETGAAGVMIGRGAIGNPWIFEGALSLAAGKPIRPPTVADRMVTLERHAELIASVARDDRERVRELRRYASAYSKGLPGGRHFRVHAMKAEDAETLVTLTRNFLADARPEAA
ncbi:MAG: tRNA-dihydrouridine synthase [Deltaproteobacteria bacterium]|nr:tRNA-dihydrouridine synthase [Deltaproteobacteria bacterium]MBW2395295.1 tRNA-dihydrouridine synthase [Deltaproteobacteria bacterium]